MKNIEILKNLTLFKGLDDEELIEIKNIYQMRRLMKQEKLSLLLVMR